MDLGSIKSSLQDSQYQLNNIEIDSLDGARASVLVELLAAHKNFVDSVLLAASARGVAVNQHNVDGARSGAAWVASKTGVSEKQARLRLYVSKLLADLPDVAAALESGEISLQKATVVARGSKKSASRASILLGIARTGSVEQIEAKIREMNARDDEGDEHERRRKSQFVGIRQCSDNMVRGQICLLPEFAVGLLKAHKDAQGATAYERAESFTEKLSGLGKKTTQVVFHLDLLTDRTELKGFGPVARQAALNLLEQASMALVGTINNKLAWFSEQDRRSSTKPVPEYVRRAVLACAYDACEVEGCVNPAAHVDHITARCNKGINDPENLQAICEPDHHAKTKKDAPWTAGGIYGKYADTG